MDTRIITIVRKLFEDRAEIKGMEYALGRFRTIRLFYTFIQKLIDKKNYFFYPQIFPQKSESKSLFSNINFDEVQRSLKKEAVAFGFNLPAHIVNELYTFAVNEPCIRSGDRKIFKYPEVSDGKLSNDGKPVVLGLIMNPHECSAVDKICKDSILFKVVEKYLGYIPRKIKSRLFWSFVHKDLDDEFRMHHWQTVKYHFDADGYNFVYANFYITRTDAMSGAHVMIIGSHNTKPLNMLFHSANQPDQTILNHFGQDRELMIEGLPGFGFIQDSSCYHKALAPLERERLMLQIRFS